MRMKPGNLTAIIIVVLLSDIFGIRLSAQTIDGKQGVQPEGTGEATHFSRNEVLLLGGAAYGTMWLADLLGNFLPSPYNTYAGLASIGLGTIPLWFIDPLQGALLTGLSALAFSTAYVIPAEPDLYGDENFSLRGTSFEMGQKLGMWASYRAYSAARMPTGDSKAIYRNYSFAELFGSPWRSENVSDVSFWVPLAGVAASQTAFRLLSDSGRNSVFATGKAFLGETEVPVFLGLLSTLAVSALKFTFTAIGEEAIFRDLEYREIEIAAGKTWAMVIDAITFPAMHIPGDIRNGLPAGSILLNFSWRAAITLGLQWAYDTGGLPASVASHMWVDTVINLLDFLLEGGVPRNPGALPELRIGISLRL